MTERKPPVARARTDPMESMIESALPEAGIAYTADFETGIGLDFYLPDHSVYVEVKRFHSARIAEQMSRAENVIAVQGEDAVRLLSDLLRNYQPKSRV